MIFMVRKIFRVSILATILAIAAMGCKKECMCERNLNGSNFKESDMYGIWTGNVSGYNVTAEIDASGWELSAPAADFYDYGTYTFTDTRKASLRSTKYYLNVGYAEYINITTIEVTLNSNSIQPGTYTLKRRYY